MAISGVAIYTICKKKCICLLPDIGVPICTNCIKIKKEEGAYNDGEKI